MEGLMGLFDKKDQPAKQGTDRSKPHAYKPPVLPPSSGHVACQICGLAPEDRVHGTPQSDSDMHWS
jgi:hypothetical protein